MRRLGRMTRLLLRLLPLLLLLHLVPIRVFSKPQAALTPPSIPHAPLPRLLLLLLRRLLFPPSALFPSILNILSVRAVRPMVNCEFGIRIRVLLIVSFAFPRFLLLRRLLPPPPPPPLMRLRSPPSIIQVP